MWQSRVDFVDPLKPYIEHGIWAVFDGLVVNGLVMGFKDYKPYGPKQV